MHFSLHVFDARIAGRRAISVSSGVLVIAGRRTPWRVVQAVGFLERLRGVGWRVRWSAFEVLHLPRCRVVHCFGLRRPIDIVFTTEDGVVIDIRAKVEPWRVVHRSDAQAVWELPAGAAEEWEIEIGIRLGIGPAAFASETPTGLPVHAVRNESTAVANPQ